MAIDAVQMGEIASVAAAAAVRATGFHLSNEDWAKIIGTAVGAIVWFVRLESKVRTIERDGQKLEKRVETVETRMEVRLSGIEKSLAKIEGFLSIKDNRQD